LDLLARGGFMVEEIAQARYPDAINLVAERDPIASFHATQRALAKGDCVIFEAAATAGPYHVRTDILRQEERVLHLIEIKSSSVGAEDFSAGEVFLTGKGTVRSDWREYIEDVAFQHMVLAQAFPGLKVVPYLCLVDKREAAKEADTLGHFQLETDPRRPKARPRITYNGDRAALAQSRLVTCFDVSREVAVVARDVAARAGELAALCNDGTFKRQAESIPSQYKVCRTCEFRVSAVERNGFRECWGALADVTPHVLDLHRATQIGTTKVSDPIPALLQSGRASYLDLAEGLLGNGNKWHVRRSMQHASMRAGGLEHLPAALRLALQQHTRDPGPPYHFVDFEACNICVPHHAGLKPYERVAFQFSCHTVGVDGKLTHQEFLNTQPQLPNFLFAEELRKILGDRGTIYVWTHFEQDTLVDIARQLAEWRRCDETLVLKLSRLSSTDSLDQLEDWLHRLIRLGDGGTVTWPRFCDLHALAEAHYFHPMMQGRTSIKVVLPGMWFTNDRLREHPWFIEYSKRDETGKILEPYAALQPLPLGEPDEDEAVREGTGAVRVYQDMLFRAGQTDCEKANRQALLKQYCKLDTAAMLFIYHHWLGLTPAE